MSRQSQESSQANKPQKIEEDRFIHLFQDRIKERKERIQRSSESNRYNQVQGTGDMFQMAYYQVTFHLQIMNWIDQRRINKLQDPNLSEQERESIHQVYIDSQKGIFQYLYDKICAIFSAIFGLFSSKPRRDLDQDDDDYDGPRHS